MLQVMLKKVSILLIINAFSGFILRGQSPDVRVIAAAGSSVSQGDFELCYTFGEAIVASGNSVNNTARVTGGFQQPDKGKIIKGILRDACSGLPLSNATARVETPTDSTTTNGQGEFSFEIFSKKETFLYTFRKLGNKTVSMKPYKDSFFTLNLGRVIVDSSLTISICEDQLPYRFKNALLRQAADTVITVGRDAAPEAERCDSLFRLKLKVEIPQRTTIYKVVCSHNVFILPYSGRIIREGGIYKDTLRAQSGCDSIITTYTLPFYNSPIAVDRQTACHGETFRYKNKIFTWQKPLAYDTLRGAATYGCDSISQIVVTFERAQGIDDAFTFQLDNLLDTVITVVKNDYISGNYKMTIKDSLEVGKTIISNNDGTIRLRIPVNPLSELTFSYQLCANNCPNFCSEALVTLKFTRNAQVITGGGGEPIIITPNGDGLNDVLLFEGLDLFPNNNLTVVNRWGQQVYYAKPYKNDWAGTNQAGQDLPDGTYFYSVNFELADRKVQWGSITIRR
jgi:gliding motility-associated-like protein